jgi:prepilin peptidase CpaA
MQFIRPYWSIECVLLLAVLVASVTDLRSRRIPNWLTVSALVLGFALNALVADSPLEGVWLAAKGFALAFALNLVMYMLHMTGAGDVKLLAAIGALVGHGWDFILIFFLTALIGGVLAIILMLVKGRVRQTLWNVGYMVGELMKWHAPHVTREQLDVGSSKALRLPGAVRICLGVVAFLVMARVWSPA